MKKLLCIVILSFSTIATANTPAPRMILETGVETKKFVLENIASIQQQAALHANVEQVYIDDSMVCLSSHSYIPEVGVCQLTGDLGVEGSESAFVVVVAEAKPGSGNGKVDVKVFRVSSGNY